MANTVLDITPLRSLVAVATCGGFHRAATALHLTQSAVSQHVRRLETVTGLKLVEREGRITRFTADGETMVAEARRILAAHDDAVRRLNIRSATPTLTVATTEHGADWSLPFLSQILREQRPGHAVTFRLDRSRRVIAAIENGDVDVAVYHEPVGPTTELLGPRVAMRWFGAPDLVVEPDKPLPLVVFDEPCSTRGVALDILRQAGIDFAIIVESADLAGVTAAVRAGLGVVLLPVVSRPPEGLREVASLPPSPSCALQVRFAPTVPESVQAATRAALAETTSQVEAGDRRRADALA
ncbi:transcriptional regulator, LysR family [Gordonia polyisoprenivorans VH2]|uniref:Transcriptional regulator, LysR family n=1 Tax=Gordonia polyisoprenivorans (strain DSM 44266 / VH2) TaxID=1112204 RepID=H6N4E0_GORPV|nr:LysR family transcriptional regulator [Gordonia polyisoprenivorans]AFA72409.1 transcriptional regulator, LysR family [Gordonia polyisoprenivorans VH2]